MRGKSKIAVIAVAAILVGVFIVGKISSRGQAHNENTSTASSIKDKAISKTKDQQNTAPKKEDTKLIREFKDGQLKYNTKGIPVLYYHSIGVEKGNELRVPPEKFREQMKFLKDNNYTTLTLDEAYAFFDQNKPVPEKSVVITLDDGYEDNYTNAYPILKEFGLKATIFVVTGWVDNKDLPYLTSAQLKELDKNGIDIEAHTANHDDLSKLSYEKQLETLKNSKQYLENLLNKKVTYIAYPFGKWNKDTLRAAKDAGFNMAFTIAGRWSDKTDGIYTLDRVYIGASFPLSQFKNRITNPNYKMQ